MHCYASRLTTSLSNQYKINNRFLLFHKLVDYNKSIAASTIRCHQVYRPFGGAENES